MVSGSCIQFLQEQSDVWSQLAEIRTPPIVTSDFIYVRLIGDRSIQEEDFGTVQIDRIKEMKKVARNFRRDSNTGGDMSGVKFSIVAANNHYAGFGPGTVNIFRQLLGLEEVNEAMNLSPQMT
jgi:hypothetical protein